MTYGTDIHGSQRLNPTVLTFLYCHYEAGVFVFNEISTTTEWIAMKFAAHSRVLLRIKCDVFRDSLTFHCQKCSFLVDD